MYCNVYKFNLGRSYTLNVIILADEEEENKVIRVIIKLLLVMFSDVRLTLLPRREVNWWKMRCGKASDMVPMSGMSCLITTLYRVKYAVGPNGKWHTISPSDGTKHKQTLGLTQGCERAWSHGVYRTRLSSGLVDDHQIGHVVGLARLHQRVNFMVSSVHALGSWEYQLYFLWVKK